MKATGIIRRVDDLGRVVIPTEIRRSMDIRDGEAMEIYTTNDGCVVFQKYNENDETQPDIFNESGNHAQPPVKTSRKQVMVHDYGANEERYVSLTEDQIRLLDHIKNEWRFDIDYEIVDQNTFEVV